MAAAVAEAEVDSWLQLSRWISLTYIRKLYIPKVISEIVAPLKGQSFNDEKILPGVSG